jgi:hypothetical protein
MPKIKDIEEKLPDKKEPKVCQFCGKLFFRKNQSSKKYCSDLICEKKRIVEYNKRKLEREKNARRRVDFESTSN